MPAKKDACPVCGGIKDSRAKHCNGCRVDLGWQPGRAVRQPRTRQQTLAQVLSTTKLWRECHLATKGTLSKDGYRRTEVAHRGLLLHRLVYEEIHGITLPPTITVDHLCHNADYDCPGGPTCLHRQCVNPAHLGEATIAENWTRADTWRRRRSR